MVLPRLHVCVCWSEPLLIADTCTTLLESSCRGSFPPCICCVFCVLRFPIKTCFLCLKIVSLQPSGKDSILFSYAINMRTQCFKVSNIKPRSPCADVATVHPDEGQPVYRDAPGHISLIAFSPLPTLPW